MIFIGCPHFLANSPHQRRAVRRDADHDFAAGRRAPSIGTTIPRFSNRATNPLAAGVVCPIFCAIAVMVRTFFFDRDTRAEKNLRKGNIAGRRALCKDAGQNSAAFPERCLESRSRRHGFHQEDFVQTPFPYSKPVKLDVLIVCQTIAATCSASPVAGSPWRARTSHLRHYSQI